MGIFFGDGVVVGCWCCGGGVGDDGDCVYCGCDVWLCDVVGCCVFGGVWGVGVVFFDVVWFVYGGWYCFGCGM